MVTASITWNVIELSQPSPYFPYEREITMIAPLLLRFLATKLWPWLLGLATQLVARGLNMPEIVVQSTGAFVLARVRKVENSFGISLYPMRLFRWLPAFRRRAR